MPIKTLDKRYPELGRLRLGERPASSTKPGKPLDHWRLTSANRELLEAMGGLYGIKSPIKPWEKQFELEIDSQEIDVMLPGDPWSVHMEMWSKAGCQRRCDGETAVVPYKDPDGGGLEEVPCRCIAEGKQPGIDKDTCAVTGRLKVVITDAPGVGIWLMTTGSINAALELTAQVDLLESTHSLPAMGKLVIEPRKVKKSWEQYERSFYVPVLRLSGALRGLSGLSGEGGATPAALGTGEVQERPGLDV